MACRRGNVTEMLSTGQLSCRVFLQSSEELRAAFRIDHDGVLAASSVKMGTPAGCPSIYAGCVYFHDTGRLRDDLADIGKQLRCLTDATEQIDAVC